jgi:hypothetical protein
MLSKALDADESMSNYQQMMDGVWQVAISKNLQQHPNNDVREKYNMFLLAERPERRGPEPYPETEDAFTFSLFKSSSRREQHPQVSFNFGGTALTTHKMNISETPMPNYIL